MAPPFRKAELDIYFGKGISAASSLLDAAVKYGLVEKKGAWFTAGEEKLGQGKENAVAFLEQNKDYAADLEHKLRNMLFPGQVLRTREGVPVKPVKPSADTQVGVTAKGAAAAAKPEMKAEKQKPVPEELF